MSRSRNNRTGRNDACPCGSGKKFKNCHLAHAGEDFRPVSAERAAALDRQRIKMQGLGKPIVSTVTDGSRQVVVGEKAYSSARWKTFHDFLRFYLGEIVLKGRWVEEERPKAKNQRHRLINWAEDYQSYLAANFKDGEVRSMPMSSLASAYLGLAYNLYLVSHNNGRVHKRLRHRLRDPHLFLGAWYETLVTGSMIRAGFDIELEDEQDGSTKHCEFTATYRKTGQKYSVEAKARHSQKKPITVTRQLAEALEKPAVHPRIVFIEINEPHDETLEGAVAIVKAVSENVAAVEDSFIIDGKPAPPAYLFLTNQPAGTMTTSALFAGATIAFRMPDFQPREGDIAEALDWRERHRAILDLSESLEKHSKLPSTFDGELPEFAFSEIGGARLLIGNRYVVPWENGSVVGELVSGVVSPQRGTATCILQIEGGRNVMMECKLSDQELRAYSESPETFFGTITGPEGPINDPFKFYDWIYESYRHNSKEHFLSKLLHTSPDIEALNLLPQETLAKIYAERLTRAALQQGISKAPPGPLFLRGK